MKCPNCGEILPQSTLPPQRTYAPPPPGYAAVPRDETVTVGEWVLTLFLTAIPLVGFVMLLVWAFGGGTKGSQKNYARAVLIMFAVGFILSVVLGGGLLALLAASLNGVVKTLR